MEYVDILDEYGNKTGEVQERKQAKQEGKYTLGVHVWICNSRNEFLLQKRSYQKHNFPGMWDSTGGCVQTGENSRDAILREIKEELGLHLDCDEPKYLFQLSAKENNKPMFLDVYFLKKDIDITQLKLQKEEVEEVDYVPVETVIQWYQNNPSFVKQPYFSNLLKHLEGII